MSGSCDTLGSQHGLNTMQSQKRVAPFKGSNNKKGILVTQNSQFQNSGRNLEFGSKESHLLTLEAQHYSTDMKEKAQVEPT